MGFRRYWLAAGAASALAAPACAATPAEPTVGGDWRAEITAADSPPAQATLEFTGTKNALRGVMRIGSDTLPLFDVKEAGAQLQFTVVIPGAPYVTVHYTGARMGDDLMLSGEGNNQAMFALSAHRVTPAGSPATPSPAVTASAAAPAIPEIARPSPEPVLHPLPARRAPVPASSSAAPASSAGVAGRWTAHATASGAPEKAATLEFTGSGASLAGTMRLDGQTVPLFEVKETGAKIAFTAVIPGTPYVTVHYAGERMGDALTLAGEGDNSSMVMLTAQRENTGPLAGVRIASAPPAPVPIPPPPRAEPAPSPQPPAQPPAAATAARAPALQPAPAEPALPPPPAPTVETPAIASLPPTPPPRVNLPPAPAQSAPAPAPQPEAKLALAPPSAPVGMLDGAWHASQASPGSAAPIEATLNFAGGRGTMRVGADDWPLFDVKQMGPAISFTLVIPGTPYVTIHYAGMLTGDTFEAASTDQNQGTFRLTAERGAGPVIASAEPPKPAASALQTAAAAPQLALAAPPVARAPAVAAPPPAPPPPPPVPVPPLRQRVTATAPPPRPPVRFVPPPPVDTPNPAPASPPQQQASAAPPVPTPPSLPSAPPGQQASAAPPPTPEPPPVENGPPPSWRPIPASAAAPETEIVKLPLPPLRDVAPVGRLMIPPIGWATREKLGTKVNAEAVREAAEGLDVTGLKAAGYTMIEVDDGWQGARDADGVLHPNDKFPDMRALVAAVHGRGLKFGIAISAGPKSCDGGFAGSYGHETQDARAFADWGVDYVLYEWCGADKIYTTPAEMQAALQKMGAALKATGHDIAYGIDLGGSVTAANFAPRTGANFWRTGKPLSDSWQSLIADGFENNGAVPVPPPGHWLDPGLIQVGNGGMTPDEYRMQLNLWAVIGGPFMLGDEVRIMRRETVDLLTNKEVIAIDQDSGGPGRRVVKSGDTEVWAKPLADGSIAVGLFNHGDGSAPVAVSWDQLGIEGPRQVRDLWWHQPIGTANNQYVVFLTAHTSLLLRMSK